MQPDYLMVESRGYTREIAYHHIIGKKPTLVWLGGYRSDMMGTKAEAIDQWARKSGYGSLRLDYSGHGQSGGEFIKGTISIWLEESLAVFDALDIQNAILVGSSMGGWIALRMAQELKQRGQSDKLHAMLLLAPAPDFTHELMMPNLSEAHKNQLEAKGYMEELSEYSDEPNIFTKALFDDGEKNLVMKELINVDCPIHILQGLEDKDVPYQHALKLTEFLPSENVTMTTIKDGDHRLSREQDIALLLRTAEQLI